MKIILKITMICGLLLSVFGTVEAARKYSPGVAMRMALKGDFDQSESEQILAAIPEEWKKEHRVIVRQMIQGTRGRPAKGKKPLTFPVISVGEWPADLSLRREDMYGDNGR